MTSIDLITIGVFFGALATVVLIVLALGDSASRRQKKRLDKIKQRWAGEMPIDTAATSVLIGNDDGKLGSMALKLMPRRHMLRHRLMKAGLNWSPGQYAMISVALGSLVCILAKFIFGLPLILAALAAVILGIGLPHATVSYLIGQRLRKFTKLFPEAIDLMVRGIKSGLPMSETFAAIGQEMIDPVGIEFRRITDAVKLGQTLEEALWDAAHRLDTAEFKFFVISLSVQRETGGNLAETLENLGDIIRRRMQMQLKIKAMSSEARASAYIIGSLPFVMFGILFLMNRGYVMLLFNDARGMIMIGIGLFMMLLGVMVMAKMVKFEI
jgi:tight adherence protein B